MTEYEGKQDEIRKKVIDPPLEVFHNVYPDRNFPIIHTQPEFSSVCPKTGQPDYATITITFIPNDLCLELKALKLYLTAYRNLGIFMENSVNKIADDCIRAIRPKYLKVVGDFKPRGGVKTDVVREYNEDEDEDDFFSV